MKELSTAIRKGLGLLPTKYLLRWSPTFRTPWRFDLIEVLRCDTDGMAVTTKSAATAIHAGHKMRQPKRYSFWELLMVQFRVIQ